MKDWLENVEQLLIEEQCHTVEDGKAIAYLLELINRDEGTKPKKTDQCFFCANCGKFVGNAAIRYFPAFCDNCGQRLGWKKPTRGK